jgi:YhcH/YjgK/YiaL family protein
MILDRLENAGLYKSLGDNIKEGFDFLVKTDLTTMNAGKYTIDGDRFFLLINEYETKPETECKLESHIKYIDIQLMIERAEKMGYVAKTNQQPIENFINEKDVMFYNEDATFFHVKPGEFALFFPTDLHQPGIISGEKMKVKKAVLKIKVAQ